jgi:hypothetical protein
VDNVRTIIQQQTEYIYIPDLRPEKLIPESCKSI